MSWELVNGRRRYTRTINVEGRRIRQYVGYGPEAEREAALDEQRREERRAKQQAVRDAKAELKAIEAPALSLFDLATLLGRASLVAAGLYQHHRVNGADELLFSRIVNNLWRTRGPTSSTVLLKTN